MIITEIKFKIEVTILIIKQHPNEWKCWKIKNKSLILKQIYKNNKRNITNQYEKTQKYERQ